MAKRDKNLNTTLYCYVESINEKYAKSVGKKLFGSHSAYVNALIAKDRGGEPKLGSWKAPGEADTLRKQKRKKAKPMSKKKSAPRVKKEVQNALGLAQALEEKLQDHEVYE